MIISDTSIKRPIFAFAVNLLIVISGLIAYRSLPVREYPDVEVPVISISTRYVGASPETIESSITEPMEQVLHGIEGVKSIISVSAKDASTINVEFETYRDLDLAASDVNNVVQSALGKIPQSADKPTISKARGNSSPFMWIAVKGEGYSPEELSNIADRYVKTPIQIISGVGSVIIGGQRKYAMRIWLDPAKMAAHKIDARDIRETILSNNIQLPAGKIEGETRQFDVLADAQIADPEIFANLIIKKINDNPVRIKDIGTVELGSENYHTITRYNGKNVIGIGVVKQSKSNELQVADSVRKELKQIKETLPKGVGLTMSYDSSLFVKESLKEVKIAIIIAFLLVIFVTFVFLRSFSPTIIISLAIPVSLIGTFIFLKTLGYSINVLTLLAIVIAIGLVVDDAIVVLENAFRHQEKGESKIDAARVGTQEIAFPVIATTVALVAILVPLSMLTGYTGRLFKEFAITIAVAVSISSFVALTLTPMLCSRFLTFSTKHGRLYYALENIFDSLNTNYENTLRRSLKHTGIILIFLFFTFLGCIGLFKIIPTTSIPTEDRGSLLAIIKAPQGSTLAYTDKTQRKVEEEIAKIPEVKGFFSAIGLAIGGPADTSNGIVFVKLKHWKKRKVKQQEIVSNLFQKVLDFPGALVFIVNMPSLGQSALSKQFQLIIKSTSNNLEELESVSNKVLDRLKQFSGLVNLDSDLLINNPQLEIIFNREKIADLGLSIKDVSDSFQILLSEGKVNDFILENKQYDVIPSLFPKYRSIPGQIKDIYIKGGNDEMVPLSNLISYNPKVAPSRINHYDLQRSVSISGNLAPGYPLGTALNKALKITKEELPPGFSVGFTGESREFLETKAELYFTFGIALVIIYLVLAALFESFVHPLTILLSVPLAVFGAFITLFLTGNTINLYSMIGLIMLIGLVTKNSILIVEYANQIRAKGEELLEGVIQACKIRLRPILMTSITMIFGTLPLAFATGAGAESRIPIGLAIIGGLSFSTFFILFIIPAVYILFSRKSEK